MHGQHLSIAGGDGIRRSFSICTPPSSRTLRIGVKRLPGGAFSDGVVSRLRVGDELDVMTPAGRFTTQLDPSARKTYVAIAAGSGITPVLSILAALLEGEPGSSVTLIYANRNQRSVMFLDEVHDLKDRFPERVQIVHVLSREAQDVELFSGRLDAARLSGILDAVAPAADVDEWFLCGPQEMVVDLRQAIESAGARGPVHTELFHADPVPRAPVEALADAVDGAARVTIRLDGRTSELDLRPDGPVGARGCPRRPLGPAVRLQGRGVRHLPGPPGRGLGRDGRQLGARARRDRAGLRADLPVASDHARRSCSTTTPELPLRLVDRVGCMEFRNLGNSGLKVSEISYGNWLTHGSQVEEDAALACVRQALDEGITTFDTADVYANTKAETVLGKALQGERREGLEIFTKVFWPTGPGGPNDQGLSRKHISESINGSLKRLGTDYVDLYQAHRYDHDTPLEETMEAFADVVRQGKALYIGVSEWRAEEIRAAHALARELKIPLVSNQPQYNLLWRVIEAEVVPTCEELGLGQIVWSPIAQGALTGKYLPGQQAPAGSRATDDKGGADMISRWLQDEVLTRIQQLKPIADEVGLSLAQLAVAWVLQNPNVSSAIIGASRPEQVTENAKAAGVKLEPATLKAIDEAVDPDRRARPGEDPVTPPQLTVFRADPSLS